MGRTICLTVALTVGLTGVASAATPSYPKPTKPSVQAPPKGPFKTLTVGKGGKYKSLQAAIDAAKAGDTVKLANGIYKEGVLVAGQDKRYLKIIGNIADPSKVVLEGKSVVGKDIKRAGVPAVTNQNGIMVVNADNVTVRGMTSQHYKGNGFFFLNVNGYTADHLHAFRVGTYGIYAFNSIGGSMTNDVGAWNNDSAFYIGQTPPQVKPVRSIVKNVVSYGNTLGFSGTNMRYVTISHSKFFNNGTGIVPNALHTEKYAPPEDNVITDNDVFWNNFNYYLGAPYRVAKNNVDATPYPVGVGILLFGSRTTQISNNRVFGNYLGGIGMIQQLLLGEEPGAMDLIGNSVTNNKLGLNGTDLNGRDFVYDGNGQNNCFAGNTGVQVTLPADAAAFPACPYTGGNSFSVDAQLTMVGWAVAPDHESGWITHPHAPQAGLLPLEHYATYAGKKAP